MKDELFGNKGRKDEKGVVLLIVLIMMVFVAVLATDIIKSSRYDYSGSVYLKNSYAGSALLDSAAESVEGLFIRDVVGENATAFEGFASSINSTLNNAVGHLPEGTISAEIEDESSRFPINMKTGNATVNNNVMICLLVNLCNSHGFDGADVKDYAENYVNSIRCWTGNGTLCSNDDDFYNSADPEYSSPKHNMAANDELLLIRRPEGWLTDEEFEKLYYGTETIPGLKDLVTPYSDGPMNINTVKKEIIMSFVPVNRSMDDRTTFYEDVIEARENSDGAPGWFTAIKNANAEYKKNIPDVSYTSNAVRVTIQYNSGIYTSSLMEVFKAEADKGLVKYKKYGY